MIFGLQLTGVNFGVYFVVLALALTVLIVSAGKSECE